MLAKIWKKFLLAVCIIACLFNVTYKLVNRISLERVISTQQEGVDVKTLFNLTDENPVVTNTNTVSVYNTVSDDNSVVEQEENEAEINPEEQEMENPEEQEEEAQEPKPGDPGKPMTVTDFIDRVIDGSFSN